jgi:hypothetical protein
MKFISKKGKVYWKNPEKQKLWAAKRKARTINMGDIRKAVARECIVLGDCSKDNINEITRLYIKQLKADGFLIFHKTTTNTNATRVNFFIENGTLN